MGLCWGQTRRASGQRGIIFSMWLDVCTCYGTFLFHTRTRAYSLSVTVYMARIYFDAAGKFTRPETRKSRGIRGEWYSLYSRSSPPPNNVSYPRLSSSPFASFLFTHLCDSRFTAFCHVQSSPRRMHARENSLF